VIATPAYTITELAGLNSGTSRLAINNNGAVVAGGRQVWQNGVITQLPLPGGMTFGWAEDINDNGVVVGGVSGSSSSVAMWSSGSVQTLPLLVGHTSGEAAALNNAGIVVGRSGFSTAVRWTPSVASLGNSLGGNTYSARGINDNGEIVGFYSGGAFLWRSGTMVNIGPAIGGDSLSGIAINDLGQVVSRNNTGAFIWQSGTTTQLPFVAGFAGATLLSINDAGTAVGSLWQSGFTGYTGYLWSPSTGGLAATQLADFSGWTMQHFHDVNDVGQIVGWGIKGGQIVPFMLTPVPVPEPATCVMALAGIACGGYSMWRRRKRA